MESPSAFRFPPRDIQPLHPLSSERVNSRPSRSRANRDPGTQHEKTSVHDRGIPSSPVRNANLFADYHPVITSPTKSIVLGSGLPPSPSLPEFTTLRSAHTRTNSDVQGLVKRFETLDVRDKDGEVNALRRRVERAEMDSSRATIGREEAEAETKKYKEELKESRHVERGLLKRLAKLESDYHQDKAQFARNTETYKQGLRKKSKEAFQSASLALELQESLNSHQKRLEVSKTDHARDLAKAQKFEEEARDAMCALSIMRTEYEKLKEHLEVVEREKEALKQRMDEAQLVEAAAEGGIALPGTVDEDADLLASPRKQVSPRKLMPRSPLSDDKENIGIVTKKMIDAKRLHDEIDRERSKREAAEEMIEFLRMECEFRCCECVIAARHGQDMRLSMDEIVAASIERMKADIASVLQLPSREVKDVRMDSVAEHGVAIDLDTRHDEENSAETQPVEDRDLPDAPEQTQHEPEDLSMTLAGDVIEPARAAEETLREADLKPAPLHERMELQGPEATDHPRPNEALPAYEHDASATPAQPSPSADRTPSPRPTLRTITTTTRIPMHFTPVSKPAHLPENTENHPPGDCAISDDSSALPFDREAALAAIAYRRGRAKSLANGHLTPRKQMLEGVGLGERRDVSAPMLGRGRSVASGPRSAAKGGSVGRSGGRGMRLGG